jgi:hypothetical protein
MMNNDLITRTENVSLDMHLPPGFRIIINECEIEFVSSYIKGHLNLVRLYGA